MKKHCKICGVEVSLELKNIWPSNFKSSHYRCIDCSKKKEAERRETKEWKEYHSDYGKKDYAENKEVYAQNGKAYRSSREGKAVRNNCNRRRQRGIIRSAQARRRQCAKLNLGYTICQDHNHEMLLCKAIMRQ